MTVIHYIENVLYYVLEGQVDVICGVCQCEFVGKIAQIVLLLINSDTTLARFIANLVARARDPLWEESWGSGKKAQKNAQNSLHSITIRSKYTRQARNI